MGTANKRVAETQFEVSVVTTGDTSIAWVTGSYDGQHYTWTGSAKRAPEDKPCAETGMKLALARAFEAASSQLTRQSNGALKCKDDNRAQRKVQKAKGRDEEKIKFYHVKKRVNRRRAAAKSN